MGWSAFGWRRIMCLSQKEGASRWLGFASRHVRLPRSFYQFGYGLHL